MSDNFPDLAQTVQALLDLRGDLLQLEADWESRILELPEASRPSARNLLHYVGLRRQDLRPLQERLARLGASSLGRCEPAVMISLLRVIELLRRVAVETMGDGRTADEQSSPTPASGIDFGYGPRIIQERADALFGSSNSERRVRIMVTMSTAAADDPQFIERLMLDGMDCLRINCAHDDPAVWNRMIENLRMAEERLGRRCRVLMDLGGPKLRTGPIEASPPVLKWRPQRDAFGRVLIPARLLLTPPSARIEQHDADASLSVSRSLFKQLEVGDRLHCRDARGRLRTLHVVARRPAGWLVESTRTGYLTPGMKLRRVARGANRGSERIAGRVEPFDGRVRPLELRAGDSLWLDAHLLPGRHAIRDDAGRATSPARIGCTLPEVVSQLKLGERVLFDDGKIVALVRETRPDAARLEVTWPTQGVGKLQADKGINFPDSELELSSLTEKDLRDLDFVVRHADLVGYSFVRTPRDVKRLQDELQRRGGERLGIVLKIENRQSFERLPALLLAAMRNHSAGVMIARGDLAVECGYERLAEVQEEILWLCEAAHMPVVWATQVLENLAKTGSPSRAEITDAAMSERAECVMLNKGPHIRDAVRMLDDILGRMQSHQSKKRSLFRRLRVAEFAAPGKLFGES